MNRKKTAVAIKVLIGKDVKQFKEVYRSAIKESRDAVDNKVLDAAIQSGDEKRILKAIGFDKFKSRLSQMNVPFITSFVSGAQQAFGELLPRTQKLTRSIDLLSPFIKDYISRHSANMVTNITDDTRDALAKAVSNILRTGKSYKSMADDVKSYVGLTVPQQQTLDRYRETLIENKISQTRISEALERRNAQMLKVRAEMIGRTESFNALSAGRQSLWEQMQEDNIIEPTTLRAWYTANEERVCRICKPMHNQKRLLNEPFQTGDGRLIMSPTAHPQCRCVVFLDL